MTARKKTSGPVDHTSDLPASVLGRGKDEMTQAEIDALYSGAPDTRYGIGSASETRPVVFEEPLMAALDEQGEVEL